MSSHILLTTLKNNIKKAPLQVRTNKNKFHRDEKLSKSITFRKRRFWTYDNKGYITLEAAMVIPIFLFACLAFLNMAMLMMTDVSIYQALLESADYGAEYAYFLKDETLDNGTKSNIGVSAISIALLTAKLREYLEDDIWVEKFIVGGAKGITLIGSEVMTDGEHVVLKATCIGKLQIPLIGEYEVLLHNQVKQKAYIGYVRHDNDDEEGYVYVTEYESVYHTHRSCTHIALNISEMLQAEFMLQGTNRQPCHFCASPKNAGYKVYLAKEGTVYHYSLNCSGLKRTVRRIRKSEAAGLGVCQRCGG